MKKKIRTHANLVRDWETYQAIRDFDDGSHAAVVDHLIPHRSEVDGTPEGKAIFANRRKRLYNVNFVNPYLFLHWCHMSQPMTFGGMEGDALKSIEADATGFRKSFVTVARDRLWHRIRDGRVGTLVDGPADIATDRASARAAGERSFQVLYAATEIRDWAFFTKGPRKGQLSRLVLRQPNEEIAGQECEVYRLFEQKDDANARFEFFDLACRARRSEVLGERSQELDVLPGRFGVGGLAEIPFVLWGDGPEESFAKDTWFLNFSWMNLNSVVSHIIYNQGFQRSIFSGIDKEEIAKMTEWTVTVTSSDRAQIFTIPPGDPVAAQLECDKLKREIHRRAKFEFNQLADDTRQVQSAESKTVDQKVRVKIYDNTLDEQTEVEREICRLHALYEGAAAENVDVSIGRDYGLDDDSAELAEMKEVWNEARELGVVELQKQILKIRAARLKFLPTDDETEDEVRDAMMDAVDAAQPAPRSSSTLLGAQGRGLFQNLPPVTND